MTENKIHPVKSREAGAAKPQFNGVKKIEKRDGKIVDFDQSKITNAIYKATEAVGEPNYNSARKFSSRVVEILKKKLFDKRKWIPKVEEVQDIVEQVLIELGQARTAKAYILYRQKRAEIRKEKRQVLQKTEIDEVDKRFDLNALRVLCSRYLKKDQFGKIIESPKQLFERVAVHAVLPSLFYSPKVFHPHTKRGQAASGGKISKASPRYDVGAYPFREFDPKKNEGKFQIGSFMLNQFHLEALKILYGRFNQRGQVKVSWPKFLELLKKGEFDSYQEEIKQYYDLMTERKFLPNTPALANFGNFLGMGSACFCLGIDDSIESIMGTLTKASIIFKSGGGVGYNFSNLRPEGSFVKTTGGVSSGPISFMSLFDKMTDVVKQGGIRRGASIGILDSDHPDIEKFIMAKRGNLQLRNFNISVFIKSNFWEYYKNNKPYPLVNPHNGQIAKYVDPRNLFNLIVYQAWESAEPGVIFEEHINKYNPLFKSFGPIRATNPCVTGDTLVAVADGRDYVSIKQLAEEKRDVPVYCYGEDKVQIRMGRNPRKTREKVPAWKVTLDNGSHIITTEDHKFRDRNNNEIKLKDLKPGISLLPFYKFQYLATGKRTPYWGICQNDGQRARAEHRMVAEFYLERKIQKYPQEVVHHKNSDGLDNRIENLEIMSQSEHDSFHQTGERNVMRRKWWQKLSDKEKDIYRKNMSEAVSREGNGMYGRKHKKGTKELMSKIRKKYFANPEHRKNLSISITRLYREHPEIKERISKARTFHPLLRSKCPNCSKDIVFKEYKKKVFCSHSCASIYSNRHRDTSGLRQTKARKRAELRGILYNLGLEFLEKNNRLPKYKEFQEFVESKNNRSGDVRSTFGGFTNFKEELSMHNHKVVSVEFYGYQDVYNITVDDFHTVAYITNPGAKTKITKKTLLSGIITSQCGEVPLFQNESCNLGSINVWAFIKTHPTNGRKKHVEFDWSGFEKTIRIATRFLDNVVDVNKYPLPEIEEMTLKTRKLGLGVMGLGDLLYDLEISYNSQEGLDWMEKLSEFLNYYSKLASIELAKEKGKFPHYEQSFYPEGKLPIRGGEGRKSGHLDWRKVKEEIKKYGIRNAHTTCAAPTGSLSMIAGCSSGIEPVYSLVFEKKVTVGSFYYVDPVFEKVMMREGLFDEDLIKDVSGWEGSCQKISYIPQKIKKVFVTAMDMSAREHILALVSLQKWTDASISKTINFPTEATVEDMKRAYLLAHQLGCKDLTVFRNKSIKGVLSAGKRKEEKKKVSRLISLEDVKARGLSVYREAGAHEDNRIGLGQEFEKNNNSNLELCPKCHTALVMTEGCKKCPRCGWSPCGT